MMSKVQQMTKRKLNIIIIITVTVIIIITIIIHSNFSPFLIE